MKRVLIVFLLLGVGIDTFFTNTEDSDNEDAYLDVPQLLEKYEYPVEEHEVETEDGYILKMHRIPNKAHKKKKKLPVFVQHGLLCSSADYVILGPSKSLAYLLADDGYDVWLGNARGNTYSRHHSSLDPDGREFWQFSWHEIGVYDLPTMIDYVLEKTSSEQIYYIGHSQGTTAFYVMASELPEYNKKIRLMINLSPVVFMSHAKSPFMRLSSPFSNLLKDGLSLFGGFELTVKSDLYYKMKDANCKDGSIVQAVCSHITFILCGFDEDQMNTTALPVIFGHTPAGASSMQCLHYGQLIDSGKFRQYDHGLKNIFKYDQPTPPNYKLHLVTAPIVLIYSVNDWLSDVEDVEKLADILPNVVFKYKVPHPEFNHLDFLYAKDLKTLVNDKVLELLLQH